MLKSPQVASKLLMASSGLSSWMVNHLSLWQMRITFLSLHLAIVNSSCALTHVTVTTTPSNGLNLTFPFTAILLLSPTPTLCSTTRSYGGHQPLGISTAHHTTGLCQPRYNELRTSVIFLQDHIKKYQQSTRVTRPQGEWNSLVIEPSVKWLQQVLYQLHSVQMSFCHLEFVVWDLQRMWLYVWAVLDYMEIYKPRMDGLAPPSSDTADTIGTFTNSIRVAQDMFLTSLPLWLIWPSSDFGDQKIFVIGEVFHPKDYFILEPHKFNYPVIFKGLATDLEKYHAIKTYSRNFLCSKDPFAMLCTPSSLAGPSQPSTSSTPAVASSSETQHSTERDFQGAVRMPARCCRAGQSSVFDILIYYNIKSFLKVHINCPVIMGVINFSWSQSSPWHRSWSMPGLKPWLLSTMMPLR